MHAKKQIFIGFLVIVFTISLVVNIIFFASLVPINLFFPLEQERISFGDKILVTREVMLGDKKLLQKFQKAEERGMEEMKKHNFKEAVKEFDEALEVYRNAPETLIYRNNANALDSSNPYTIAVIVPSDKHPYQALDMLRGFAQAQDEFNQIGGHNGRLLKLEIVNDSDDREIAERIATSLVKDDEVLAIAGHWTSDVSLAAAEVYDKNQLVFIAPISTTDKLSSFGSYIFRTNIDNYTGGRALADYMVNKLKKKKAAVFFVPQVSYSEELKSQFTSSLVFEGGEVVAEFVFPMSNFNAKQNFEKAKEQGAEVLMLATDNSSVDKALQVIQINHNSGGQFKILGDLANLYRFGVLANFKQAVNGMVMAVSLHHASATTKFSNKARDLWGSPELNYTVAMSYNAAQALIEALKLSRPNPSRVEIKEKLEAPEFSATGASGKFRFSTQHNIYPKPVQMVKVCSSHSSVGLDFVPIRSDDPKEPC